MNKLITNTLLPEYHLTNNIYNDKYGYVKFNLDYKAMAPPQPSKQESDFMNIMRMTLKHFHLKAQKVNMLPFFIRVEYGVLSERLHLHGVLFRSPLLSKVPPFDFANVFKKLWNEKFSETSKCEPYATNPSTSFLQYCFKTKPNELEYIRTTPNKYNLPYVKLSKQLTRQIKQSNKDME